MANIYKSKNDLKSELKTRSKQIALIWFITAILLVVGISINNKEIIGVFLLISIFITIKNLNKIQILKVGIKGEKEALKLVSELDDNYHVFANIKLYFQKKKSETDLIIVGPKGLFIVEVKNHNGYIEGNEEDRNWLQHKTGRKGGKYLKTLYNPIKQVNTHIYRLSQILKQEKIYTWIGGMIYFVNKDVKINVRADKTPVFTLDKKLSDCIKNIEPKKTLSEKEIIEVVKTMKKLL